MATRYQIADEPAPGPLSQLIVNPSWPLLGMMFGGAWLAWPWFLVNGYALGSATRRREHMLLAIAVVGSVLLAFLAAATVPAAASAEDRLRLFRYALVAVRAFKVSLGYLLFREQQKSFQLHETFGGKDRNAAIVLFVAYGVRKVLFSLTDNLVLLIVLA